MTSLCRTTQKLVVHGRENI